MKNATIKNATLIDKEMVDEEDLMKNKTRNTKKLFEFEVKAKVIEKLNKVEVEDKRVTKPCDTKIITGKTIEGLLQYFELVPGESKYEVEKKLSKQWIHEQGRKPNKMKRAAMKETMQPVDEAASESNDDETESEEEEDDDKKSKTKKSEKSDDESGDGSGSDDE